MTNFFSVNIRNFKFFHISVRIFVVAVAFVVDFSPWYLLWTFMAYLTYFTIGQSIMMHRYYSHNMFEFNNVATKWLFILITIMSARGAPIGWSYIHRVHHANVDNEDDPHSPHNPGFSILKISDTNNMSGNIQPLKVRNLLTKENLRLTDYYWLYALTVPVIMILLSVELFYYGWLVPVFMFQILSQIFNYANHYHIVGSYKSHSTGKVGHSVNNILLWTLTLGEAWHNNHHAQPGNLNFGQKWWELDPSYWIIKLVKKDRNDN